MDIIRVKSPTRVDLAGGTLDLWPLYNFVHGAQTVNVAIDIWTEVEIQPRTDAQIVFESPDLDAKKVFRNLEEVLSSEDPTWALNRSVVRFWKPQKGFNLLTRSQSPVGGGLGGSSSLTVSLMKAFAQWIQKNELSSHSLVHTCHNIESELLQTPTGTQDYYPALSGGLNILTYSASGIQQEVLNPKGTLLDDHFMLIYTGKAHHSGLNNFEVMKSAVQKDQKVLKALAQLKEISQELAHDIHRGSYNNFGRLFQEEYKARIQLCEDFSSPEIRKLNEISIKNGAEALKICGAGGGGCVLVWCHPQQQKQVGDACQKAGFRVLDAKPVSPL